MNQRMLELAIEARTYAESKPDIYQVAYDKKFAELLVQECADVIARDISTGMDHSDFSDGMTWGLRMAINSIKEHFGLEKS